jgi:hypothetical protein
VCGSTGDSAEMDTHPSVGAPDHRQPPTRHATEGSGSKPTQAAAAVRSHPRTVDSTETTKSAKEHYNRAAASSVARRPQSEREAKHNRSMGPMCVPRSNPTHTLQSTSNIFFCQQQLCPPLANSVSVAAKKVSAKLCAAWPQRSLHDCPHAKRLARAIGGACTVDLRDAQHHLSGPREPLAPDP